MKNIQLCVWIYLDILSDFLKPAQHKVDTLFKTMFKDAWHNQQPGRTDEKKALKAKIADLDKQISTLLDRILETTNQGVIQAMKKAERI